MIMAKRVAVPPKHVAPSTDAHLMGVGIGTMSGWEQQDQWAIILMDFQPNEKGRAFVPDFVGPRDLCVDFETGEVSVFDNDGAQTLMRTDWSGFNRDKTGPGWQPPVIVDEPPKPMKRRRR